PPATVVRWSAPMRSDNPRADPSGRCARSRRPHLAQEDKTMTDRPEEKRQLENLELNRETLQDLTQAEGAAVKGGAVGGVEERVSKLDLICGGSGTTAVRGC